MLIGGAAVRRRSLEQVLEISFVAQVRSGLGEFPGALAIGGCASDGEGLGPPRWRGLPGVELKRAARSRLISVASCSSLIEWPFAESAEPFCVAVFDDGGGAKIRR